MTIDTANAIIIEAVGVPATKAEPGGRSGLWPRSDWPAGVRAEVARRMLAYNFDADQGRAALVNARIDSKFPRIQPREFFEIMDRLKRMTLARVTRKEKPPEPEIMGRSMLKIRREWASRTYKGAYDHWSDVEWIAHLHAFIPRDKATDIALARARRDIECMTSEPSEIECALGLVRAVFADDQNTSGDAWERAGGPVAREVAATP